MDPAVIVVDAVVSGSELRVSSEPWEPTAHTTIEGCSGEGRYRGRQRPEREFMTSQRELPR
ncbi:cTP synthase [Anopheles sinensis]|uniref:CTP synthase n=1 Tax=Anopheles sinensis TaxID=74873 RepID=A0A084WQ58_ANOSI|nr:cTP synthase [Anopheles sinensis]